MKKIAIVVVLTLMAGLIAVFVKDMDSSKVNALLKEYKIIASKSDLYYSYDQITKKHPWGLVVKNEGLYFITDLDGNLLNEQGFKRIGSFDGYGMAEVESSEGLLGLINSQGEIILEALYDDINKFGEDQLAIVETRIPYGDQHGTQQVRYKSREGLIDRSGRFVIEPEFFNITYLEDINLYNVDYFHYQESLGSKESLFSASSGWLENATYDDIGKFKDGLAIVTKNKQSGLINQDGSIVIPPIYRNVFEVSEGLIRVDTERETAFFDVTGNIVIPFSDHRGGIFNHGVSIVYPPKSNRKVALMDKTGTFLTDYSFDDIEPFRSYEGLDKVLALAGPLNSRFNGLIDTTGQYVIEPKYSRIHYAENGFFRTETFVFSPDRNVPTQTFHYFIDLQGNEFVELGSTNPKGEKPDNIGKLGILAQNKSIIAAPIYDDVRAEFSDTLAVKQGVRWGVVNAEAKVLLPIEYQSIDIISSAFALVKQNDKWGVINPQSNSLLLPIEYDELKYLSLKQINVLKNNQWVVVDL